MSAHMGAQEQVDRPVAVVVAQAEPIDPNDARIAVDGPH